MQYRSNDKVRQKDRDNQCMLPFSISSMLWILRTAVLLEWPREKMSICLFYFQFAVTYGPDKIHSSISGLSS